MPLFYLLAFCIAYNGPHAIHMGGLQSSAWHYSASEHLGKMASSILFMIGCDVVVVAGTVCLFRRFNLSLFEYYAKCLEMYWLPAALVQCFAIDHQFCIVVLHCGMDFTFAFDWLG